MSDKEKLHFKIGLSGTSQTKSPEFIIRLDEAIQVHDKVTQQSNTIQYFEFEAEIDEGSHILSIDFVNKLSTDTVLDENQNIVNDLLLNIESIEIDEIELGNIIWTLSTYKPLYPEDYRLEMAKNNQDLEEILDNCVNLGWNGKWSLKFDSPFYLWLLENI